MLDAQNKNSISNAPNSAEKRRTRQRDALITSLRVGDHILFLSLRKFGSLNKLLAARRVEKFRFFTFYGECEESALGCTLSRLTVMPIKFPFRLRCLLFFRVILFFYPLLRVFLSPLFILSLFSFNVTQLVIVYEYTRQKTGRSNRDRVRR